MYQLDTYDSSNNGNYSYSTLPKKFMCKRKINGLDDGSNQGILMGPDYSQMDSADFNARFGLYPPLPAQSGGELSNIQQIFNKNKKEPPLPPKRTNSFKTDVHSLFGIAGDKLRAKGKLDLESSLLSSSRISEVIQASNRTYDTSFSLNSSHEDADNMLNGNESLQSQMSFVDSVEQNDGKILKGVRLGDWQDSRTAGDSSDDSDSGLESRQSVSSGSLASNGSGGTIDSNTLPFANENVGTIKQRNSTAKTSIVSNSDSKKLNVSIFDEGTATIRRNNNKTLLRCDTDNGIQGEYRVVDMW